MKNIQIVALLVFFSLGCYAQNEANNWYFGHNVGLDFNSGVPVPLLDGALDTEEGCSTISDTNGQLLFYTDGVFTWNKNHTLMPNGFLAGHPSSSQSAIIVSKPAFSDRYYIFTTGVISNITSVSHGLHSYEVDMNLEGGLGNVIAGSNFEHIAYTCEKLTAVKHANGIDTWVIAHEWGNNKFYTYLVSASGISLPVVSSVGVYYNGSFYCSTGYLKASPDGSKLMCANAELPSQLLDFDSATGVISNPYLFSTPAIPAQGYYGAEFSPSGRFLYLTDVLNNGIFQLDLTAPDIEGSKVLIDNTTHFHALQLAPDGKIYVAQPDAVYNKYLGVINDPEGLGAACGFQVQGVYLSGGSENLCRSGLPQFNQSYFSLGIISQNFCIGNSTSFSLTGNQTILSATWDFGDGTPASNSINPTHTYASTGTYTVSVTATSASGTSTKTRYIVISIVPTATQPQNMLVCDTNNNGLYNFDLTTQNTAILSGQNPSLYTIKYYANNTDYTNRVAIAAPANYENAVAYQQQTIIAEVFNNANQDCKSTTTFTIDVFDMPLPNTPANIPNLTLCDNTSVGSDTDGKVRFDLTQRATAILNGQSPIIFSISYYTDAALTNIIAIPATYQNTNPTETIYVKVVNNDNSACLATTSFTIQVFALPVITNVFNLKQCDDNTDGFSVFNLEEAIPQISANAANETFGFFETSTEAQSNSDPITNVTAYTNQTVSNDVVYVRVTNTNGCFRIAQLNLIVSTTQIPVTFTQKNFTQCDDAVSGTNTDGIASFDFSSVTTQIQNIFPAGQLLDITYYRNLADALAESNAITNIANYRNIGYPTTQNIYIRVDSQLNNDCLGLGSHITLNVERIPIVNPIVEIHCDDDQDGLYPFNTSAIQTTLLNGLTNVTVSYYDQNNNPLPSPLPNPFLTASQTLRAVVTNSTPTACSYETTIQFIVDDLPQAFPVATPLTTVCDDEVDPAAQNGLYAFNTSTFESAILGSQTGMIVNYFDQNNNALSSPLPNPFTTTTQNVRVEVINPTNTTCKATLIIPFIVKPVPNINLLGEELVCSNLPTFTKEINAGIQDATPISSYTYLWSLNGQVIPGETNYILTINAEGIYTVEVSNAQGCSRTRVITVTASDVATINDISIVDLSNPNSIIVYVTGSGDYVFGLDDEFGFYQDSNVFTNVSAGIHTVFVKDLNQCGIVPKEVAVLGIPIYFTPNGDGFNDLWNIKGANARFNEKTIIYIFDRYGKLLKQISPVSQGWNGTYNGIPMPSSDYWYAIQLEDGRNVKGHFTLKR